MQTKAQELLRRMRVSKSHLSEVTGIHLTRISLILNRVDDPRPHEAEKLCYFFDRDESELLQTIGV